LIGTGSPKLHSDKTIINASAPALTALHFGAIAKKWKKKARTTKQSQEQGNDNEPLQKEHLHNGCDPKSTPA
jgi:hypothetical protein